MDLGRRWVEPRTITGRTRSSSGQHTTTIRLSKLHFVSIGASRQRLEFFVPLAPAAPEKKRQGAPAAPRDKRCNNHRRIVGCMLSGARRVHPVIVGWSTPQIACLLPRPIMLAEVSEWTHPAQRPDPAKDGGGSSLSWTRTIYIFLRQRTSGRMPSHLRK